MFHCIAYLHLNASLSFSKWLQGEMEHIGNINSAVDTFRFFEWHSVCDFISAPSKLFSFCKTTKKKQGKRNSKSRWNIFISRSNFSFWIFLFAFWGRVVVLCGESKFLLFRFIARFSASFHDSQRLFDVTYVIFYFSRNQIWNKNWMKHQQQATDMAL